MNIKVNVKRIGKKKPSVAEAVCEVEGCPATVRELITAVVDSQVKDYNWRKQQTEVLSCLTLEEIENQARAGKISYGINYGEKEAKLPEAQANALQCFEDGIYRVFMDGRPLESLDEPIAVTEENVFTFVRLTMLAGRMW